ncbi:hypothetical protein [Massilia sp. DD77]|uniref:hypothetical protein n=1 Tax=Massilia sp. DD77 TaxID=3109349 RepID=UPI002FFE2CE7
MKLIAPIPITDQVMAASTLSESDSVDAPLWTTGAKTVGQRVRRPDHRIYECVVAHSATAASTDYPENNLTGASAKWILVRPTNLFAAFDSVMNTASVADSEVLSWTLTPGVRVDSVALFGVYASSVRVRVTLPDGSVKYDQTQNLRLRNCRTFTEWFFKPVSFRRDVSFTDIPAYRNAIFEVIVSWPGNLPQVGEVQIGRFDFLGNVQWKPSVRTVDYSKVETDQWGGTKFTPRRAVRVVEYDLFVENESVDEVIRLLTSAKSSPRAWLGSPKFGALNLFGFAQDFQIVVDGPAGSFLNLQIQELT